MKNTWSNNEAKIAPTLYLEAVQHYRYSIHCSTTSITELRHRKPRKNSCFMKQQNYRVWDNVKEIQIH